MRRRFPYIFIIYTAIAAIILTAIYRRQCDTPAGKMPAGKTSAYHTLPETTENALAIIANDYNLHDTPAGTPADTMPDDSCIRMHINPIGGPIRTVLRDSNYMHYGVADMLGIKPINTDADAWLLRRPLLRMHSCREFYIAELSHSYPYLVPEASQLLHEIGAAFNDSLKSRGGGDYRLKVTSLLRTAGSVRKLRRVNRAAVDMSAHQFGTTFDISYTRFMLVNPNGIHRTQEDLKNLLAEVILDFRNADRCYVIYEHRSGCFHITTRPPGHPPIPRPAYLDSIDAQKSTKAARRHSRRRR